MLRQGCKCPTDRADGRAIFKLSKGCTPHDIGPILCESLLHERGEAVELTREDLAVVESRHHVGSGVP